MRDPGEQLSEAEEDAIVAKIVAKRHQRLDDDEFRAAAEGWTRVEGGPRRSRTTSMS